MAIKTPFFQAFGPLLFGRAPRRELEKVRRIDSLEQLYGLFGDLIPAKLLEPTEKGANSRDRSLPPRVTFWAFVAQVMSPGMPCREIVRKVEAWWRWAQKDRAGSLTASAYCQARARLDKEVLGLIAGQIRWTLERNTLKTEQWLGGRSVKIVDGTSVSMPDTEANQKVWPQPGSQQPGLGFPLMKLDVLRCKSPDLIEKELAIHLIAYNLVRVLMQRSAHLHHVSLERISFKGTLDTARHFADVIHAAASSPRKQQHLIDDMLTLIARDLLPERPGRSEPRAKKRRPKNYQLLTKPRSHMGNLPHRNRTNRKSS